MLRCSLVALSVLAFGQVSNCAPLEKWISLFDGKSLKGWTPKIRGSKLGDNFGNTFRIENGAITVRYDAYEKFDERFGHLFYKIPYGSYRLRAEYRFVGNQCPGGPGWAYKNSGFMIHGQRPETMTVDQDFPVSIEVQLLGADSGQKRPTANLCTPGTNVVYKGKLHRVHCTESTSETFPGEQWVTVEIEVHSAGELVHRINGTEVMRYEQPQFDPNDGNAKPLIKDPEKLLIPSGTISLQSESHPVQFRNIQLQILPN
jgi:hypothetical protein